MTMSGTVLGGRYRLQERFAANAIAEVWRGHDDVLGRTVAVKVLPARLHNEPGFADQFIAGARTVAMLKHPNIVDVYDIGRGYLVMEYVDGTLAGALRKVGRLTAARAMTIIAQTAEALQATHDRGVIHRDLRAENILVRRDGTAVLTGFDLAAAPGRPGPRPSAALAGALISPEEAQGRLGTPLSDVYLLGVVAYQALAGIPPFSGPNPYEVAMRHLREPLPPLPADVPGPVRHVVERALAKNPADRWPGALTFAIAARTAAATAPIRA
jgi:serine/threonine protein kinase